MYKIFLVMFILWPGWVTPLWANEIPPALTQLDKNIHQAVVVEGGAAGDIHALVSGWEETSQGWQEVIAPVAAVVGRRGLAPVGKKREGDGRTPSGVFALRRAFGYARHVATGLSYRQVTARDFWIDDPASPKYNQWVSGPAPNVSHEILRRSDDLYQYAVVVEYNTSPVVAGAGSAIFLHVWRGPEKPTAGCVAMPAKALRRFLRWLDARQDPVIVLAAGKYP